MDGVRDVLRKLDAVADRSRLAGMARYGIQTDRALGVAVPDLRRLARSIGTDHALAADLWATEIHEARMLAAMVDDPALVTGTQMEVWVREFDSWDLCDQVCSNLFDRTSLAFVKAAEWTRREEEFVKRAGFTLMATAAVHRKDVDDVEFLAFLPLIRAEATDERNYVKKAVNWALRQIGKRSPKLNRRSIETAKEIAGLDSRAARWIASDALRELTSAPVQERLRSKAEA